MVSLNFTLTTFSIIKVTGLIYVFALSIGIAPDTLADGELSGEELFDFWNTPETQENLVK